VSGLDAVVTTVRQAVKLTLGEWFLDTSLGVAWLDQAETSPQILGRMPVDLALARSEVVRATLAVEGVLSVTALNFDLARPTRTLSATIYITTVYSASAVPVEETIIL
jgi:hypothetical protein